MPDALGDHFPAPKLFGSLPPGLFGVFHHASRTEYARIILELWRSFYSDPLQDHPTAKEVILLVEGRLRRGLDGGAPGPGAYSHLVEAGWLAPYADGYRTLVEMPEAVSRLVRILSDLERGAGTSLGGAVAAMLSALRAARDNPEGNALTIRDTAQRAEEFLWRLRALVTGLRRLEASILEQADPGEVLGRFFERFVSVVVSDWHTLKTAHNPYRHRGEIVEVAASLLDDDGRLDRFALAYAEQELAPGAGAGRIAVANDLDRIRAALLGLDQLTDRIDAVRRRVERRIAVTVSHLELSGGVTAPRLGDLVRRLADASEPDGGLPFPTLAPAPGWLCPAALAGPRAPRSRVASAPPPREPPDPRLEAFVRARHAFMERIRVGNRLLAGFAARKLAAGAPVRAADIPIETLEDAVAYCALPVAGSRREQWPTFEVQLLPGRAATAHLDGPDFVLRPASGDTDAG